MRHLNIGHANIWGWKCSGKATNILANRKKNIWKVFPVVLLTIIRVLKLYVNIVPCSNERWNVREIAFCINAEISPLKKEPIILEMLAVCYAPIDQGVSSRSLEV